MGISEMQHLVCICKYDLLTAAAPLASSGRGHQLNPVACECEIVDCQQLPDGRYYLEIVGRRRFRLLDVWEQVWSSLTHPTPAFIAAR